MSFKTVAVLAALAAVQEAQAAVDCSSKAVEWDIKFLPESYVYDASAGTTKFCYTVGYKTAATTDALCGPKGGVTQSLTRFGARFESCFVNENAGLRAEEGTWAPVHDDEGYVEDTMDSDTQFNGDLWTTGLPAVGSTNTYCATFKRKLELSPTPNVAVLAQDAERFAVTTVQGPQCYLAPPTTTTPPPPPTTTTTTTTVPPVPTTTVPVPTTTSVPPTTVTPEPSTVYADNVEEVTPPSQPTAGASTASPTTGSVNVGAVAGAGVGAGLLAAAAGAFVYKRRAAIAGASQQEVLA